MSSLRLRHRILTLGCALLMAALALLTVIGEDGLVHRHLRVRELVGYQEEITSLEEQNFQLRTRIRRLRDRPIELERAAASDLLMSRPEAVVFHFSRSETAAGLPGPGDEAAPTAGAEGAGRRSP